MSKAVVAREPDVAKIEAILIRGDLAPMTDAQRLTYVKSMCKAMGISILFRPFDFIKFDGKVLLYANRAAGDQLRKKHKISIKVVKREFDDGLYIVTVQASMPGGRTDESIAALNVKGLSGLAKANALMKCETKAKRRVTLSIMGLGMIDEQEIQDSMAREEKVAQEVAIEETSQKLAETVGRPEFETERPAPSVETSAPPTQTGDPAKFEYKVKSIKKVKGQPLEKVAMNKLVSWLKSYDEMVKAGESLHADVQDDAFHIRAFLEEAAITPQGPTP